MDQRQTDGKDARGEIGRLTHPKTVSHHTPAQRLRDRSTRCSPLASASGRKSAHHGHAQRQLTRRGRTHIDLRKAGPRPSCCASCRRHAIHLRARPSSCASCALGDLEVLADWEAQDVAWCGQPETKQVRVVRQLDLLEQRRLLARLVEEHLRAARMQRQSERVRRHARAHTPGPSSCRPAARTGRRARPPQLLRRSGD
jgi:hypothetical protein